MAIALLSLRLGLALLLLLALAEPVLGQSEEGAGPVAAVQEGPSRADFSIAIPPGFAETRPVAPGAALPGEVVLGSWRQTLGPLSVIVRAAPLPGGATLAQFLEMKRAVRRSLQGYAEVHQGAMQVSGQPAVGLDFSYRNPLGQVVRQHDVLMVFRGVGWAVSWVHPDPPAEDVRAQGEAAVSSFRFQPGARPEASELALQPAAVPVPEKPKPTVAPAADYQVVVWAAPAPGSPVEAQPAREPQVNGAAPPSLPRAGPPMPASWLAFFGVLLVESGLWLRRRLPAGGAAAAELVA